MNIFVTDSSPDVSARTLDDKRLIKMILESAQMLSTAMHLHGISNPPYKVTHKNHPCSIWVRKSRSNFRWLMDHFNELCCEYWRRYGKVHKCFNHINTFITAESSMPPGDLTSFANCSRFKEIETILAYRLTMIAKWTEDEEKKRKAKWTNSTPPTWFVP
jgi:hypothetical protein